MHHSTWWKFSGIGFVFPFFFFSFWFRSLDLCVPEFITMCFVHNILSLLLHQNNAGLKLGKISCCTTGAQCIWHMRTYSQHRSTRTITNTNKQFILQLNCRFFKLNFSLASNIKKLILINNNEWVCIALKIVSILTLNYVKRIAENWLFARILCDQLKTLNAILCIELVLIVNQMG